MSPENNPFVVRSLGPQLIGNARIFLQPLFYLFPVDEKTPIIDYKGDALGQVHVKIKAVRLVGCARRRCPSAHHRRVAWVAYAARVAGHAGRR